MMIDLKIDQAKRALLGAHQQLLRKWADADDYEMDEVSLLFSNETELARFVLSAKTKGGMEHFNSVPRDTMVRQDGTGEQFDVRFEFLRMPEAAWRIEAMCLLGGTAPLHSQMLRTEGEGCVVHASFKCKDEKDYERVKAELGSGLLLGAEYRNSYGLFSYWGYGPYWKPRVNLRDSVAVQT